MTVLFKNVSKDFQMKMSQKIPYKEEQIRIDDDLELVKFASNAWITTLY